MAIKASDHFKTYHNPNGPDITTLARPVLEQDGLYFKDIDGTGTVSAVNDCPRVLLRMRDTVCSALWPFRSPPSRCAVRCRRNFGLRGTDFLPL